MLFGVGDNGSYRELFNADKLGMVISGTWPMPDFDAAGKNYGVVGLPAFAGKPAHSQVGMSALSIAKDSKNPDLAWQFVEFYASPEAVALRTNDLPILNSVAKSRGLLDDPKYAAFFTMLPPAGDSRTPAFLRNPNWGRAQDVVNEAIQQIYVDLDNVQATLDDAADTADKALTEMTNSGRAQTVPARRGHALSCSWPHGWLGSWPSPWGHCYSPSTSAFSTGP